MFQTVDNGKDDLVHYETTKSIAVTFKVGSDCKDRIKEKLRALVVPIFIINYFIFFLLRYFSWWAMTVSIVANFKICARSGILGHWQLRSGNKTILDVRDTDGLEFRLKLAKLALEDYSFTRS